MDTVAIWLQDSRYNKEKLQRRIIRNTSDVLNLSDKSFVKNFRLSKEAFQYVLSIIINELKTPVRSTGVSPTIKLAATLAFLGQGCYQNQIGQSAHLGLAQQTVSVCVAEVCQAIEKLLCPRHISLAMTDREKRSAKSYFYEKSGIPGVIGVVDGTHIQMVRPFPNEHLYFNRKLKHSVNAMVICDHQMYIRYVNGRYGGAAHDSHVWNLSQGRELLRRNFENGEKSTWILGDSGYPLEPWILTPYRNAAENTAESLFNGNHSKIRSTIERVFGLLKARFRCLLAARELHYAPEKVSQILNVCCALHNICLLYKVEEPADIRNDEYYLNETFINNVNSGNNDYTSIGTAIRNEIKNSMSI